MNTKSKIVGGLGILSILTTLVLFFVLPDTIPSSISDSGIGTSSKVEFALVYLFMELFLFGFYYVWHKAVQFVNRASDLKETPMPKGKSTMLYKSLMAQLRYFIPIIIALIFAVLLFSQLAYVFFYLGGR